jgi:uncharacterized membrane protein
MTRAKLSFVGSRQRNDRRHRQPDARLSRRLIRSSISFGLGRPVCFGSRASSTLALLGDKIMDDRTIVLLLRLVHILAGIFWVGAIFLIAGFLLPTARAMGREGGRFMQHLMLQRRLPVFLAIAMLLTVLSGFTLYGRIVSATQGAWAGTPPGIAYGVGGLAAIVGALAGMLVSGRATRRMAAIGQQAAQGGGPSAEQQAEIERLQGRVVLGSRLVAGFLVVAAGLMAIARYL